MPTSFPRISVIGIKKYFAETNLTVTIGRLRAKLHMTQ